jgi:uncharacterized membrane protein
MVAALLGGLASGNSAGIANRANGSDGAFVSYDPSSDLSFRLGELSFGFSPDTWPSVPALMSAVMGLATGIVIGYALLTIIIGGAVELGLCNYNINLLTGKEQRPFETLFGSFHIFGKALLLRLATGLLIFLWSLLLIVPGIIAAYRYSMTGYIMAQNPDIGVMEAIERSKDMMYGNKLRLFCLDLSFIGWSLLSALTLGAGSLFLNPYIQASRAAFYLEVSSGR